MSISELSAQIKAKKSFLCVGLDTDPTKIPKHLFEDPDPIFAFNKAIIEATAPQTVCYKINTAFYESTGISGWKSMEKTILFLNEHYPKIFTIADAKRGDIGNTSAMYAKCFFEHLGFDAVTVAPYMGEDSVSPFLEYTDKVTILLALTSNQGASNFQTQKIGEQRLYKKVIEISQKWKNSNQLMYVVGATKTEYLSGIRELIPNTFLLVPGVGSQGGNLKDVCKYAITKNIGLLVNSSRGIIYESSGIDFAQCAQIKAKELQEQMSLEIEKISEV